MPTEHEALKRLKMRYLDGQCSSSNTYKTSMPTAPPGRRKEDSNELSKTHCTKLTDRQDMEESPQEDAERTKTIPLLVPSQLLSQSKEKQHSSSDFLFDENVDASHPSSMSESDKKEVKSCLRKIRIRNAFRAMKVIGIKKNKARPVLKALLISTGRNWELIEEDNYRALADAVLKGDKREVEVHPSENVDNEIQEILKEEAHEVERLRKRYLVSQCSYLDTSNTNMPAEHEEPMKRLKMRYLDGQCSSSNTYKTSMPTAPPGRRKEDSNELSKTHCTKLTDRQDMEESPQEDAERTKTIPLLVPSELLCQSKVKKSSSSDFLVDDNDDLSHPSGVNKRDIKEVEEHARENVDNKQSVRLTNAPRVPSHPKTLKHRGTEAAAIQTLPKDKRPVSKSLPHAIQLKEPDVESDTLSSPKSKKTGSVIKPKDEPTTGDMLCSEVLFNMFHIGKSHGGISQNRNNMVREDCTLEPPSLQSGTERNTADYTVALDESRNNETSRGECSSTLKNAFSPSGEVKLSLSSKLAHGRPKLTAKDVRGEKAFVDSPSGTKVPERINGMNGVTQLNKLDAEDEIVINRENQGTIQDVVDIAKGQEKFAITLVNEVNDERPPSFCYIRQNIIFQNAYANFSLSRMGDNNCCSTCSGDCLSSPVACACSHETGGEFAYTADGLVKEEFLHDCISMNRNPEKHCRYFCKECPLERSKCGGIIEPCEGPLVRKFVKECWIKCGCTIECGNLVVQRGISRKLQGWGLRTLEDLPKGAFVCEYIGEILTNAELFERVSRIPEGEKHSYPVLLDADWCAEGILKDEEALCLDATYYGNIVRFINHRCHDSNLVEIPVEVETPDHHYYHLAFFTSRQVKAMEELTWDYGIDFDDHEHPIKAFHCQCGSKFCRNTKRSKSKARRR